MGNEGVVFQSPAQIAVDDFAGDPDGYRKFQDSWGRNLTGWTRQSILGNPWSNVNDDQRSWYLDPTVAGWPTNTPAAVKWHAFPNRLTTFFTQNPNGNPDPSKNPRGALRGYLSDDELLQLADRGRIAKDGETWVLDDPAAGEHLLQIPASLCESAGECTFGVDWTGDFAAFAPAGPRGWLDEYCEWAIERNGSGDMVRIEFTCENPDYWFTLWSVDPDLVVRLYRKYVNASVMRDDLSLRDAQGRIVVDPLTDLPAYDPTNKWNRGTELLPDAGGAMHLTSPPNTLGAEIYLAAAGTIGRPPACSTDPEVLICCARYGQPYRNSDPHIGHSANGAAIGGKMITLSDPVGLYMQRPDFDDYFEFPGGTAADDWYRVTRGRVGTDGAMDMILHATFAPPEAGYSMQDVTVRVENSSDYLPLTAAGQIARTFYMALGVNTADPPAGTPPQTARPCVASAPRPRPWPSQLIPQRMLEAGSPSALPAAVPAGTALPQMALVVTGTKPTAATAVTFDAAGVSAVVHDVVPVGNAPGQTTSDAYAIVLTLTVEADVQPGDIGIRVVDGGDPSAVPFAVGLLSVLG